MRNFKNYSVWKISHELVLDVYKFTALLPTDEK